MKKQKDHQATPEKRVKAKLKTAHHKTKKKENNQLKRSPLQKIRKYATRHMLKKKLANSDLTSESHKQASQMLFKVSINQMEQLVSKGKQINKNFKTKNESAKKKIIKEYMEKMKKVLGSKEVSRYKKWFQKLDFDSLSKELMKSLLQKKLDQIVKMEKQNAELEKQNAKLEKQLREKDYYNESKVMTLEKYQSIFQSYRESCNAAKTSYSKDYQTDLFRWVKEENVTYLQLLQKEKKGLGEKLKITPNGPSKSIMKAQLELLEEKGDNLAQEYIKDIKKLLSGGFLIDVRKSDNLRLLAELLSFGFNLRYTAFLAHKKFQKNFRHYTQATIKASSFAGRKQFLKAARQVIRSVLASEKLMHCLTEFMNVNPLCRRARRRFQEDEIRYSLKETMDFEFFDGDCSLNGITLCKEGQPQIYFNTFRLYRDPEYQLSKEYISLFKTFVFFTYLHEIPNYLVRSLGITSSESKRSSRIPRIETKNIQEERGSYFQKYVFGQVVIDIFSYQYDKFMEAQKEDINLQEYFKQEEEKKKRINPIFSGFLHMEFRQYPHLQQLIRRIPFNWCGTSFNR